MYLLLGPPTSRHCFGLAHRWPTTRPLGCKRAGFVVVCGSALSVAQAGGEGAEAAASSSSTPPPAAPALATPAKMKPVEFVQVAVGAEGRRGRALQDLDCRYGLRREPCALHFRRSFRPRAFEWQCDVTGTAARGDSPSPPCGMKLDVGRAVERRPQCRLLILPVPEVKRNKLAELSSMLDGVKKAPSGSLPMLEKFVSEADVTEQFKDTRCFTHSSAQLVSRLLV